MHVFVHRNRHNMKAALGFEEDQILETVQNSSKNDNILIYSINEQGESILISFISLYYNTCLENNIITDDSSDSSSIITLTKLTTKYFTFTFSLEEWKQIQPEEVMFMSNDFMKPKRSARFYYVLPKGLWTSLMAELFWEHTKLPSCITFKRAKVYEYGNSYITVDGRCFVCGSIFKGILSNKPSENRKVIYIF